MGGHILSFAPEARRDDSISLRASDKVETAAVTTL